MTPLPVQTALIWSLGTLCFPGGGAVGEDAQRVRNVVDGVRAYLSGSLYLSDGREELLSQLRQAVEECFAVGLEDKAAAIRLKEAYVLARQFIEGYPSYLRRPEIGALPDGEVTFEWYRGPRQTLFASLNAQGRLSYAGIFHDDEVTDAIQYTGGFPPLLWAQIEKLESFN